MFLKNFIKNGKEGNGTVIEIEAGLLPLCIGTIDAIFQLVKR